MSEIKNLKTGDLFSLRKMERRMSFLDIARLKTYLLLLTLVSTR